MRDQTIGGNVIEYTEPASDKMKQKADAIKIQTLETKNTELETKYNDLLARVLALENN